MKFGVREICDVVLKAKANVTIGNKVFYKNEPVLYFDTLKTSSLEGSATTVYATGGKGNARLVAWEGERTVTFNMEDALISPESFMVLTGAGLIEPTETAPVYEHVIENTSDYVVTEDGVYVWLEQKPYLPEDQGDNFCYVMAFDKSGVSMSEPYIPAHGEFNGVNQGMLDDGGEDCPYDPIPKGEIQYRSNERKYRIFIPAVGHDDYVDGEGSYTPSNWAEDFDMCHHVLVDYYTAKKSHVSQIEITADKFGGNYYLEASTLFRDTNGTDLPAEFIIPNCKIQSNFSFSMAATGDPSTFNFVLDAFPDYTRFDKTKKVICAIQISTPQDRVFSDHREATKHTEALYDR